jgi:hypothetical protein
MNHVILIIGYAFIIVCALDVLLRGYEFVMTRLWKRLLDSRDFYRVVMRYADERKHTREHNRVGFSDE